MQIARDYAASGRANGPCISTRCPIFNSFERKLLWIESGAGANAVEIFIAFEQEMLRGAACSQGARLPLLDSIYDDSRPKAALADEFFRH